jgi:hypothetical protein
MPAATASLQCQEADAETRIHYDRGSHSRPSVLRVRRSPQPAVPMLPMRLPECAYSGRRIGLAHGRLDCHDLVLVERRGARVLWRAGESAAARARVAEGPLHPSGEALPGLPGLPGQKPQRQAPTAGIPFPCLAEPAPSPRQRVRRRRRPRSAAPPGVRRRGGGQPRSSLPGPSSPDVCQPSLTRTPP